MNLEDYNLTNERLFEIEQEVKRRMNLWLNHWHPFITTFWSEMWFERNLGLFGGYRYKKKYWMKKNDFENFISEQEFHTDEYNKLIKKLYWEYYKYFNK